MAFAGWQRIAAWSAPDATADTGVAAGAAPWLLLTAIALCGAALLVAL
jgi:hypothetical protein